jgi:hypothetical protein
LKEKKNSFFLFQSFYSLEGHIEEYFLPEAQKCCLPSSFSFEISTNFRRWVKLDITTSSSPHVAFHEIKSNFAKSKFVLVGDLHCEFFSYFSTLRTMISTPPTSSTNMIPHSSLKPLWQFWKLFGVKGLRFMELGRWKQNVCKLFSIFIEFQFITSAW